MKKTALFILMLFIVAPAYCDIITTNKYSPSYYDNQYRIKSPYQHTSTNNRYRNDLLKSYNYYGINRSDLSALEKYALKKNYNRENDINRLERLEELAFGSIQDGDISTRYKNVEKAILERPQNDYENQSFLSKIGNFFAGQMTGYTPNIMSSFNNGYDYDRFYPSYYNNINNQYYNNGPFGGYGYNNFNHSFGNGSGIRILK